MMLKEKMIEHRVEFSHFGSDDRSALMLLAVSLHLPRFYTQLCCFITVCANFLYIEYDLEL